VQNNEEELLVTYYLELKHGDVYVRYDLAMVKAFPLIPKYIVDKC